MRLKILGCGTSTGVPLPGCGCEVCTSKDPRNYRDRASALLTDDTGFAVLIDATPDLRQQSLRHGIKKIDAVFYTHAHADHILGTDDLRCFNFVLKKPIPVYASNITANELVRFFHYIFDPDPNYQGGALTKLELNRFEDGEALQIGPIKLQTFIIDHGATVVTGFRVGDLAYATDCKALPIAAQEIIRGAKYLILDGLREGSAHPTHLTIEEAVALAQTLDVEQTYLTHMTHTVDYTAVSAKLPKGFGLCVDGMELEF